MIRKNGIFAMAITTLAAVCIFAPQNARAQSPATETYSIGIKGMTCETCSTHAQKELASISGVVKATVDYKAGHAWVTVNKPATQNRAAKPRSISAELASAISKAGYKPTVNYVLTIKGMTCEDCAKHVVAALKNVPGVVSSSVSYKEGYAIIVPDATKLTRPNDLVLAIQKAGYSAVIHSRP